jgi:hypothetical protein
MQNNLGILRYTNVFEALLEVIWCNNGIFLVLVGDYDHTLVLASHHESLPEVCLGLEASL